MNVSVLNNKDLIGKEFLDYKTAPECGDGSAKILLLVKGNPKVAGSKRSGWFDLYRNGMTINEYKAAAGKDARTDIRIDLKKGYIALYKDKGRI